MEKPAPKQTGSFRLFIFQQIFDLTIQDEANLCKKVQVRLSNAPDYQEMYLILCRAAEKAIRILIAAQQQCEELYCSTGEKRSETE